MPKKGICSLKRITILLPASMVVTYYIKPYFMGAARHNSILMSLFQGKCGKNHLILCLYRVNTTFSLGCCFSRQSCTCFYFYISYHVQKNDFWHKSYSKCNMPLVIREVLFRVLFSHFHYFAVFKFISCYMNL